MNPTDPTDPTDPMDPMDPRDVVNAVAAGRQAARELVAVAGAVPGVRVEPGLTGAELDSVQARFGFTFAADHRAFLTVALPVGEGWPDWRAGDDADLRRRLEWPVRGVLFDVEHNVYWSDAWGPRPAATADALALAGERLAGVPQLVPVYLHRCLPSGRVMVGHPVLSVYQTDVIYYGMNLLDYVHQEFGAGQGIDRSDLRWRPRASVAFWRDLIE